MVNPLAAMFAHRIIGGYLKGQDLATDTGEIPPPRRSATVDSAN
jgi:hypothetical protein